MAKRKKRLAQRGKKSDVASTSPEPPPSTQLAPANPPQRNPTMLAVSLLLFCAWFVYLIYLALRSNS